MGDDSWLEQPRYSETYVNGVKDFIKNVFSSYSTGDQCRCPCKRCNNRKWHNRDTIYDHLICNGCSPNFFNWTRDVSQMQDFSESVHETVRGQEFDDGLNEMLHATFAYETENSGLKVGPNADAKNFYKLLDEGKQPLYEGCEKFSRLSFTIRLYLFKCTHGVTEAAFSDLLEVIRDAFPFANVPKSFNAAKSVIKDLGLGYEKIHACPNDCMLFWADNQSEDTCKTCGASRWKLTEGESISGDVNTKNKMTKVAAKVMRYFPLKPRLQRMYMCKEFSESMIWHARDRKDDGKLRHPADGQAWKAMDARYPQFSLEARNVRFGLASDGFNPFQTMSISHSTWPIVLVNYNLPPWLSIKEQNLILSTLIPGPTSPGKNIDVYMQPLITELKELWDVGLETYDARNDETFLLRASILWTISDFPGYAMLSGWSTQGKLACPTCHYETSSMYLKHSKKMCYMNHRKFLDINHEWRSDRRKFNGDIEVGEEPSQLSGLDVEDLLSGFKNSFGKQIKKRKRNSNIPWRKKSIFFELPYWKYNLCRHNLDVIHIEKNIFDNILGTLLNISGKSKDHFNARFDLQEMGIRKVLHPTFSSDGKHIEIRPAIFDMNDKEKELFCSVLHDSKLPHGTASNIGRCVEMSARKVSGYKSHDAHFILQNLLQFAMRKSLKREVALPLMKLGSFFKSLCNKVIDPNDLEKLQNGIVETICQLEMIFPPSFFDIMVHLPVHLCKEVELGGPVYNRWMYFIERFLGKLKFFVRNKSKPEGSMAEAYLVEECLTFCSRYMGENVKTKRHNFSNKSERDGYPLGIGRNKKGKAIHMDDDTFIKSHRYILFNCGSDEIEKLMREHQIIVENIAKAKKYKRARAHSEEFHKWLKNVVMQTGDVSKQLLSLAKGPNRVAKRFSGYVINGYRFHTINRDKKRTTQNSGVFLKALTTCFASSNDQKPMTEDVSYYGSVQEIIEVDYWAEYTAVLFRCCWYQEEKDDYALLRVNFNKLCYKNDPFVLATQVQQVFYIEDATEKGLHYVVKNCPRNFFDIEDTKNDSEEEMVEPPLHDRDDINLWECIWERTDVPRTEIPVELNDYVADEPHPDMEDTNEIE